MFTVQKGHEEATKQLLNAGADVNFISGYWTPISLAARMGNLSILKLLLKKVRQPQSDPSDLRKASPSQVRRLTLAMEHGCGHEGGQSVARGRQGVERSTSRL
jgi:ankyrin repeat protein